MGKIYSFVLGMAAGFGLYHLSLSYHVIRASDGFHLTHKTSATLADTYVDIREFTAAEALEHPQLAAAIAASDDAALQREFSGSVATNAIEQGLNQALEALKSRQE